MTIRLLRTLGVGSMAVAALVCVPTPAWAAPDKQPPTAPPNLRVVERGLTTIELAWDASADNVGVTQYWITSNADFWAHVTETRDLAWGLTPDTAYEFVVRAVDAAGNMSAPSAVQTRTLVDIEPPTVPGNFQATAIGPTSSVRLTWSLSSDDDGGCCRTDYLIEDTSGTISRTVPPITTSTTFTDLPTNRTYTFTIRARDRSGNLSDPAQTSVFLENSPPAAPANLRVVGTERGRPVIGWDPAVDNSGQIAWYTVTIDAGIHTVQTPDLRVPLADLTEQCLLPPDREIHTFVVRATDASRNVSPPSATLEVAIPPDFC